jgi:hypothetical protein
MIFVLVRHIRDFARKIRRPQPGSNRKNVRDNRRMARHVYRQARAWILDDSPESRNSFPGFGYICGELGYDPDFARKKILAYGRKVKNGTWKRPKKF